MTVAFLADRSDIHTVRWVNGLSDRGYDISLVTMHPGGDPVRSDVSVHVLPFGAPHGYLLNVPFLRKVLSHSDPDLLHTHFASGYGTLARLGGTRPLLLSLWGSDVYEFPYRTPVHRHILVGNLDAADHLCSTSRDMAQQTRSLDDANRSISITPFGVDTTIFSPDGSEWRSILEENGMEKIVIGTVKKLEHKYGVDILIRAFANLRDHLATEHPDIAEALRLLIVGDGPLNEELKTLAYERGIGEFTTFVGKVPHTEVPAYLRTLDVYVAASRTESFGVAVIEAASCQCPTVVSNVGGLPEVVDDGETGFIVEREDVEATIKALRKLVLDPVARRKMGRAGRSYVEKFYSWPSCLDRMEEVYASVVKTDIP
jgi:glycosyltransferase involved in cell wall biosynthesis